MIIALDENQCRVVASKAKKGSNYFCQGCGNPLCLKQGKIRRPHFAHLSDTPCEFTTNKTEWHYEWQECFGLDNSEIVFSYGKFKHIADIQIGDTVIEFQHSNISAEDVAERNKFYEFWGLHVVWIFDIRKELENDSFRCYQKRPGNNWLYEWDKPSKSVLRALDTCSTVFLQVSDKYLIEVTWYPSGEYERTRGRGKKAHFEGEYWSKLSKFAGDIMDKKYAIKHITRTIDQSYTPRIQDGYDVEMIGEQIEMARMGLAY